MLSKEMQSDLSKAGYALSVSDCEPYINQAVLQLEDEIQLPADDFEDKTLILETAKSLYWRDRGELDLVR